MPQQAALTFCTRDCSSSVTRFFVHSFVQSRSVTVSSSGQCVELSAGQRKLDRTVYRGSGGTGAG